MAELRSARHDARVNDLRPALGTRLRDLRKRLGLSQEDLAHRAGVHWTYLSDLERGRQTLTLDVMNRIARASGVTLAEFFAPFDRPFKLQ
jgi:XRE family transcriptional regulator, regulator of sulfur utilization